MLSQDKIVYQSKHYQGIPPRKVMSKSSFIIFIMLQDLKIEIQFRKSPTIIARGIYVKEMFNSALKWQGKLAELCKKEKKKVPQVEAFRQYIKGNTKVKIFFQGGLDQIPQTVLQEYPEQGQGPAYIQRKTISYGLSWEDLLDQFAVIITTPLYYSDQGIIGVPFYSLLIDLLNTEKGRIFFLLDGVNARMKLIFDAYGRFLDSPESREYLTKEDNGWLSSTRLNYNQIICDQQKPYFGFESWHAWFTRQMKEQAMPFDVNAEDTIIHSTQNYPNFNMPRRNVLWRDKFWLKDKRYSLAEMFGADALPQEQQKYFRDAFEHGTVYQGYLSPYCYHRWRSPVSGVIQRCYTLGNCYFEGVPNYAFNVSEIQLCSQPLLSIASVRQIFVIKANNPKIGRICIIEIGMAEISGLVSIVKQGQHVKKGELLGMFRYGGSSQALVFDRNAQNLAFNKAIYERQINKDLGTEQPIVQRVRSPLAYVS